jgi:hypothetical protein
MQKRCGTIDGYFSQGLGLDSVTIEKLKSTFQRRTEAK